MRKRVTTADVARAAGDEDTAAERPGVTLTGVGLPVPDLPDGDCASAPVRLRRVA
ncbi:hypothetical protein AB0H51_18225 [Streptomyces griseoluteus]|uniref:hypothetical protein n=1 Tax=Streptomyces griseoluteus TaxID=29306 RepID=UPI0033C274A3